MIEIIQNFSTSAWWIPYASLLANLALLLAVLYLLNYRGSHAAVKTADARIAKMFKEAEFRGAQIVTEATERAKKILSEATISKISLETRVDRAFDDIIIMVQSRVKDENLAFSLQLKKKMDEEILLLEQEAIKIIEDLKEHGKKQLGYFTESMQTETKNIHEELFRDIEQNVEVIKQDMNTYRERQYKKIDQNMNMIIQATFREYLKYILSYENNEDIIFKSLEKYKSDNLEAKKNGNQ